MDENKYKTVVHYIINSCINPFKLGSIKLNKILFFSDADMYLKNKTSITGDEYIKRQFGPVPKHILDILGSLEKEKKIAISKEENNSYNRTIYLSLQNVDISNLKAEEIDVISYNRDVICNDFTAKEISNITHNEILDMADIGETIPLYAIYANKLGEIDETDIKIFENILK